MIDRVIFGIITCTIILVIVLVSRPASHEVQQTQQVRQLDPSPLTPQQRIDQAFDALRKGY